MDGQQGGNPLMAAIMQAAQAQQGGTPDGGQGAPGAGQPAPPGVPQQPPDPRMFIMQGMQMLQQGMSALGLDETFRKVLSMVEKSVQQLFKNNPQGRQEATQQAGVPQSPPAGVGQMPGAPMA